MCNYLNLLLLPKKMWIDLHAHTGICEKKWNLLLCQKSFVGYAKSGKKSILDYFQMREPLKIEIVTTQQRNNLSQF